MECYIRDRFTLFIFTYLSIHDILGDYKLKTYLPSTQYHSTMYYMYHISSDTFFVLSILTISFCFHIFIFVNLCSTDHIRWWSRKWLFRRHCYRRYFPQKWNVCFTNHCHDNPNGCNHCVLPWVSVVTSITDGDYLLEEGGGCVTCHSNLYGSWKNKFSGIIGKKPVALWFFFLTVTWCLKIW